MDDQGKGGLEQTYSAVTGMTGLPKLMRWC